MMKANIILISALIITTISCVNKPERSEDISVQNDNNENFDIEAATKIIEQRCNEFVNAVKVGDSLAVGELYTLDTKLFPNVIGRNNIVKVARGMALGSLTGMTFKIINLWGNDNIIVQDGYFEFSHSNGTIVSKGHGLLIWKKEEDAWRIFRDVYKPDVE